MARRNPNRLPLLLPKPPPFHEDGSIMIAVINHDHTGRVGIVRSGRRRISWLPKGTTIEQAEAALALAAEEQGDD